MHERVILMVHGLLIPIILNSNLRKIGYDITGGMLSVTRKTVTLVAEKTYDGNNALVNDGINPDELTIGNLFAGESLTFTDDAHLTTMWLLSTAIDM